MPRAKKTVSKKSETSTEVDVKKLKAALKKELKKELQVQLEESLLNIEIEPSEAPEIDLNELKGQIRQEVEKEFNTKLKQISSIQKGETQALNMSWLFRI